MSALYARFEKYLTSSSRILDLGCGSGRDLKYFSQKYDVIGLEPSPTLAKYAKGYSGQTVINSTIQSANNLAKFDAIWACASLLHIPSIELSTTYKKLSRLLIEGGTIYCSFKYGKFEGERNGRYFTDLTESKIEDYIFDHDLKIEKHWITDDLRPGRENERWLNLILVKE